MKKHFKKYNLRIWKDGEKAVYLKPPFYEFWADPFLFDVGNEIYVFFEAYNYFTNKGHISVGTYDPLKKKLIRVKKILNEGFHLSYPQIFKDGNSIYMLPETFERNSVNLYRFTSFPYELKFEKCLLNGKIRVDSTLFKKDEIYYLFTNKRSSISKGKFDFLEIYYSYSILGDYKKIESIEVPINDDSNARMAGNIICLEDRIFRPSQRGTEYYGEYINFNLIEEISPKKYKESSCTKLELGIKNMHHTYNECSNYKIIDEVKYSGILFVIFTILCRAPLKPFSKMINNKRRKKYGKR